MNFSSVIFDDKNGALTALNEIINAGYTKIAHFAGYSNVSISRERCLGYKLALEKNGIEIYPDWIIEGGFEVEDGYDAFLKLVHTNNLPEIVFTVNDRVALGVYQAAKETGLSIPEDFGIVAFGFCETAQTFTIVLSIINQNPRRIGRVATDMLIAEIENKETAKNNQIIIEEEFLWNHSIKRKSVD
ncbi:substrate-binding domain-containing protein [bacterium]